MQMDINFEMNVIQYKEFDKSNSYFTSHLQKYFALALLKLSF